MLLDFQQGGDLVHKVAVTACRLPGPAMVKYCSDTDCRGLGTERYSSMINMTRAMDDSGSANSLYLAGDCEDSAMFNAAMHSAFMTHTKSVGNVSTATDAVASTLAQLTCGIVTCGVTAPSTSSTVRSSSDQVLTHSTAIMAPPAAIRAMIARASCCTHGV